MMGAILEAIYDYKRYDLCGCGLKEPSWLTFADPLMAVSLFPFIHSYFYLNLVFTYF